MVCVCVSPSGQNISEFLIQYTHTRLNVALTLAARVNSFPTI